MPSSPVKSAARTFEVLELFAEHRDPMRLNQISTLLNYPQSSTTVLLKSLMTLGYLNYNRAARTYFPSTKVAALGDWISHSVFDEGRLIEMMRAIQVSTGETVGLIAQNDLYVQYLRVVDSSHQVRYHQQESDMRLITDSSAGIVLLSRLPEHAIDKICRLVNARERDRTKKVDIKHVLELTAQTNRVGYCFFCGVPAPDFATISFLLPPESHPTPLAVMVGGTDQRITTQKEHIITVMREAIATYATPTA